MTEQLTLVSKGALRFRNVCIAACMAIIALAVVTRPKQEPVRGNDTASITEYAHFRCQPEGGLVELMVREDGSFFFECKSGHAEFKPRRQAPGTVTPKPPAPVPLPGKPGIAA